MAITPAEAIAIRNQRMQSAPPAFEFGTVRSVDVANMVCSVQVNGDPEMIPYGRTIDALGTLGVGDRVLVHRSGTRSYIGDVFTYSGAFDQQPPSADDDSGKAGTTYFTALDSGTWSPGTNTWSAGRTTAYQGDPGGGQVTGAWFYDDVPGSALSGATVQACSIQVQRQSIGADPATLHFYLHNSALRPVDGLTAFIAGPTDASVPVSTPTRVTLPVSWGQQLVDNDYGIAIYGNPWLGVKGLNTDPASGQLQIDWIRV